jgi:hypothetical protein
VTNSVIFQDQAFVPVGTSVGLAELDGEQLIRVVKPEENTEPDVATYARLADSDFRDGTIEVDVRARLMHWADVDCRGFIGIVFRANDANDRFEGFYVRPRNGRSCTEPQRRIHTMQYFSFPGYTFAYFRERGISDYEAQADIEMDEWIHLKAEVAGAGAKFVAGFGSAAAPADWGSALSLEASALRADTEYFLEVTATDGGTSLSSIFRFRTLEANKATMMILR